MTIHRTLSFMAAAGALGLAWPTTPAYGAEPPAVPGAASPSESDKQKALALFEESETLYQQGRFGEAASLLEQAYALQQEPLLLYNLARALEGQGEFARAAAEYERYLEAVPQATDRGAIEQRARTLREKDAKQRALEAERRDAEAKLAALEKSERAGKPDGQEPTEPSVLAGPFPWVLFGVGIAGVGAGVVVGLLAEGKHQDAVDEPVQAEAQSLQEGAEDLALGATVAYVAGGGIAALGAILGIVGLAGAADSSGDSTGAAAPSAARRSTASPSVGWAIGPGSVSVSGRF